MKKTNAIKLKTFFGKKKETLKPDFVKQGVVVLAKKAKQVEEKTKSIEEMILKTQENASLKTATAISEIETTRKTFSENLSLVKKALQFLHKKQNDDFSVLNGNVEKINKEVLSFKEQVLKEINDLWWSRKSVSQGGAGIPIVTNVASVSKQITYNSDGTVNVVTDANGTKTMVYSSGVLVQIKGTGAYKTKNLTYNGTNQITNITVS